jgi:hypothetical protein
MSHGPIDEALELTLPELDALAMEPVLVPEDLLETDAVVDFDVIAAELELPLENDVPLDDELDEPRNAIAPVSVGFVRSGVTVIEPFPDTQYE